MDLFLFLQGYRFFPIFDKCFNLSLAHIFQAQQAKVHQLLQETEAAQAGSVEITRHWQG